MKKSGYTLVEVLITLGIIGIIAAILLPLMNKIKVNEEKVMYLKAHDSVVSTIKSLAKNSREYNVCRDVNTEESANCSEVPLFNTQRSFSNPSAVGDEKLCRLMADALNGKDVACSSTVYMAANYSDSTVFDPPSFVTQNGMRWRVSPQIPTIIQPSGRGQFETAIYVDVNGSEKGGNCLYNSVSCTNPDIFKFLVGANGIVVPADAKGASYLKNRNSFLGKDSTGTVGTIASTFSLTPCIISTKHELCLNTGGLWNSATETCFCQNEFTWDDTVGCKQEEPEIKDDSDKKEDLDEIIEKPDIIPKEDNCSKKISNYLRIAVGAGSWDTAGYSADYRCNKSDLSSDNLGRANACIIADFDPATPITVTLGGTQYARLPIVMQDTVFQLGTIDHFEKIYIESVSPKCDDKYAYVYAPGNSGSGSSGSGSSGSGKPKEKSDEPLDFKGREY